MSGYCIGLSGRPPIKPVKIDRHGPLWDADQCWELAAREINAPKGKYLQRKAKAMAEDFDSAKAIVENAYTTFKASADRLVMQTEEVKGSIKKVSGDVRKAADDLASGLQRVEKTANFQNLERYVNLLERAATAFTALAELEKTGRLEKISSALK